VIYGVVKDPAVKVQMITIGPMLLCARSVLIVNVQSWSMRLKFLLCMDTGVEYGGQSGCASPSLIELGGQRYSFDPPKKNRDGIFENIETT